MSGASFPPAYIIQSHTIPTQVLRPSHERQPLRPQTAVEFFSDRAEPTLCRQQRMSRRPPARGNATDKKSNECLRQFVRKTARPLRGRTQTHHNKRKDATKYPPRIPPVYVCAVGAALPARSPPRAPSKARPTA